MDTLYQGDCVDFMADMDAESVDMTLTSPLMTTCEPITDTTLILRLSQMQLFRITKQGGVVVWVVGDQAKNGNESGTSFRQALYFKEIGFNLFDTMIYQKQPRGARGNSKGYWQTFEYMFVLAKKGFPKTINLLMDRPNKDTRKNQMAGKRSKSGKIKHRYYDGWGEYGRRTNVWEYAVGYGSASKDKIAHQHPAIFPEKLAEDHILSWTNPDDLVFDPMCGSGTTGKMALLNNRQFIGVDISAEYVAIARERLGLLNDLNMAEIINS